MSAYKDKQLSLLELPQNPSVTVKGQSLKNRDVTTECNNMLAEMLQVTSNFIFLEKHLWTEVHFFYVIVL